MTAFVFVNWQCALGAGGQAWAVNERQAEALQRAAEALRCAAASAADGLPLDFWALDLRGALLALGEARLRCVSTVGVLQKSPYCTVWALDLRGPLLALGEARLGALYFASYLPFAPVLRTANSHDVAFAAGDRRRGERAGAR